MILCGASGHAKVIQDIVEAQGDHVTMLVDDNPEITEFRGIDVTHAMPQTKEPTIISIGNNRIRRMIAERIGGPFGTAIHPSAVVSLSARIKEGTVVMPNAVIQSEACIGNHCIINTGVIVEHENLISDYVHLSPHATLCGNVSVGEGTWIGAGATVIQGITIGKNCIIGAGSVVVRDIPDNCVAYGNPCRVVRKLGLP